MPNVGRGVQELRVRDAAGVYRAFYVLQSARGVIVFHAFGKKSQKTLAAEIELGRRRLREVIYEGNFAHCHAKRQ
jgi:phage-related protein